MGTLEYTVKDNFLENSLFKKIQEMLFSSWMPWYFSREQTVGEKDGYYFFHHFYQNFLPKSNLYELISPVLSNFNIKSLISIRANLVTNRDKIYSSAIHNDTDHINKTAILYMNTCNGYTLLNMDKEIKINCIENRVLIFDSQIKHCAVSQTDKKRRIVINFNYF
jgi:hypothetical protein